MKNILVYFFLFLALSVLGYTPPDSGTDALTNSTPYATSTFTRMSDGVGGYYTNNAITPIPSDGTYLLTEYGTYSYGSPVLHDGTWTEDTGATGISITEGGELTVGTLSVQIPVLYTAKVNAPTLRPFEIPVTFYFQNPGTMPDLIVDAPDVSLNSFDAFSPPTSNNLAAATGTPQISEFTRIANDGDTIALTGENLTSNFVAYGEGVITNEILAMLDGRIAALTLSGDLPSDEVYMLWPTNSTGFGTPVLINKTESWWATETVSTGETFYIYGRNLSLGGESTWAWCDEEEEWLYSSTNNPYRAGFTVPDDWENGTYTLYAHNQKGREYGWADPVEIEVVDAWEWDEDTNNWFNVVSYGAKPDDDDDDYAGIEDACIAAKNKGDDCTVYFPDGTYETSHSFHHIDYGMRWVGEDMETTILKAHSSYGEGNNYGLVYNTSYDGPVAFKNIQFVEDADLSSISGDALITVDNNSQNTVFSNVWFNQIGKTVVTNQESRKLVIADESSNTSFLNCRFNFADEIKAKTTTGLVIKDCTFIGMNDAYLCISVSEADMVSATGNLFYDYNRSAEHGMMQGRCFYGRNKAVGMSNIYFADNTTSNLTVSATYAEEEHNNTGEQYMSEFGYTHLRDYPTVVTASSMTFPSVVSNHAGHVITILDGVGKGQYRVATSSDAGANKVYFDTPFLVEPTTSSLVSVCSSPYRHAVYNNSFDGTPAAYTNSDASGASAVMAYGEQVDLVVDSNTINELKRGLVIVSAAKTGAMGRVYNPAVFNVYQNNSITNIMRGIVLQEAISTSTPAYDDWILFCNVFRNNFISNSTEAVVRFRSIETAMTMEMNVFDNNSFYDWSDNLIENDDKFTVDYSEQLWVGNTTNGAAWNP